MTMVDSIKVYGKTKDAFGWPEDNEDGAVTNTGHANGTQASSAGMNNEVIVIWSRRVSCIFFLLFGCRRISMPVLLNNCRNWNVLPWMCLKVSIPLCIFMRPMRNLPNWNLPHWKLVSNFGYFLYCTCNQSNSENFSCSTSGREPFHTDLTAIKHHLIF